MINEIKSSNLKQKHYLEGATPTIFGPRPLNMALGPSVLIICLIQFHMVIRFFPIANDDDDDDDVDVDVVDDVFLTRLGSLSKLATDDCRRVLTTSNGQVAMAPNVPPSLFWKKVIINNFKIKKIQNKQTI